MGTEEQDFIVLDASDIQDFNEQGVLPLPAEKLVEIQTWLAPTDYATGSSEYGKHRVSHLDGTGTWITQVDQYQKWHNSARGVLWIKAIAGAGKSVIAASLTSKLAAEEQVPVLYFFFRRIVSANQKPQSLVRDYMSQLLEYSPELQRSLYELIDDRRSLDSVSFDQLWKTLVSALSRFPRAYCIADALDEMDSGNEFFLHNLVALAEKESAAIKVLMTSRPVPRVEQILQQSCVLEITLEPQLIYPDISAYTLHRVNKCNVSEKVRAKIHSMMCARADGHFLYARLMIDELLEPSKNLLSREEDLFLALDQLPTPMAEMYAQMLLDHSQRSGVSQELQLTLLQWITSAERPFRLLELSSMVDFQRSGLDVSKDTKLIVREGCGPLLEILADETVCPIHHSFTEYLYDLGRLQLSQETATFAVLDYEEAQSAIAITCIRYLASDWHRQWQSVSKSDKTRNNSIDGTALKMIFPFLEYASTNWHKHVRKSGRKDAAMASEIDALFLSEPDMLSSWLSFAAATENKSYPNALEPKLVNTWKPLQVAAAKGLGFYVEHLIEKGHDIECSDAKRDAPLALAACHGHDEAVVVLLKHGAQNDKDDSDGLKPLHYAANNNHHDVVRLLLESGVDPFTPKSKEYPGRWCGNAPRTTGDTAVEYACKNGHLEVIKAFMPYLEGDKLYRTLAWAFHFGQATLATALLEAPDIDVNRVVGNQTLLYLASSGRHIEIMRSLIRTGANAHALSRRSSSNSKRSGMMVMHPKDSWKVNPLHGFARFAGRCASNPDCDASLINSGFEMLLDAGLDPNIVDPGGQTVLHHVLRSNSKQGVEDTLSLLFNRGLSASSLTPDGSNALHSASHVSIAVVDMLIARGVDINHVRKSDWRTPLMAALARRDLVVAQHLLDRGADTNLADANGNTPLHFLATVPGRQSNLDMINALIAAGADVNERNKDGNTAMHLVKGKRKLLSTFLEHGFNIEAKNKKGHTILFQCISQSRLTTDTEYKTLIEAGASPLTRDFQGSTILHDILKHMRDSAPTEDVIRYFVEKGVDPLSQDNSGNTLWHVAARLGSSHYQKEQLAVMNLLMDYGVSPTARNNAGQTSLHIAFSERRSSSNSYGAIEYLLERSGAGVNVADYDKIRPIHLASSFDFELTCHLLDLGADPTAVTIEGQTPLIVACRNRQCDIVCRLLDYYRDHSQLAWIDRVDYQGRSALHYACKSGRPEVVAMLLNAGATVDFVDNEGYTPLHLCAEYLDEQASWDAADAVRSIRESDKPGYILSTDPSRPRKNHSSPPIRIRETIRLLAASGVDMSFLISKPDLSVRFHYPSDPKPNPLTYAIHKGCEAMISELLIMQNDLLQAKLSNVERGITSDNGTSDEVTGDIEAIRKGWTAHLDKYDNRVRLVRMRYMPNILAEEVKPGEDNASLVEKLLKEDDEPSVEEAARLGACFLELDNSGNSALIHMASWGFTDLMRKVGQDAAKMTLAWRREKAVLNVNWREERLKSILHTALVKQTPNLGMVKLLVSEFKLGRNDKSSEYEYEDTAAYYLHLIARPSHWWQTRALEFLLESGADVDAVNPNQDTPLIAALRQPYGNAYSPARVRAVEILLRHGANPNAVDKNGLTCLNISGGQPSCTKMLLKHGASPSLGSRPFIFDAIRAQDIESLQMVVDSGEDVNVLTRPEPESESEEDAPGEDEGLFDLQRWFFRQLHKETDLSRWAYPIHVAASHYTDTSEKKEKATKIVNLLLGAGANPFLFYKNGSSIIHSLAERGGIVEPFLLHPSFDTESQDHKGRTLLLAASQGLVDRHPDRDTTLISLLIQRGASLTAIDRDGCNALHFLLPVLSMENLLSVDKLLLPILVTQPNLQGRTPYHQAVSAHRFNVLHILLSLGADPLIPDPLDGSTALHHLAPCLACHGNIFVSNTRTLMTLEDISKFSAESKSNPLSNDGLREHMHTKMPPDDRLASTAEDSLRCHITTLLACGLSIDARDHKGETPLFKLITRSIQSGYKVTLLSALKILEDAGADIKARNNKGQSILHKLATEVSQKRRYEERLTSGNGYTSKSEDLQDVFKWLVDKGVDVRWEDEANRTCLDVAAATGAQWVLDMYKRK